MVPLVQWLLPKALQEQLVVHEQLLPPIRSGGELFSWKALWEGGGNALGSITELQIVNNLLWGARFAPAPVLDWDLSCLLCLNELNKLPMLNLSGNIFLFLCAFHFSSKFIWLSCSYVHLLWYNWRHCHCSSRLWLSPEMKICMLFLNEIKMLNNLRALGWILSSCFEIDLIIQNYISLVLQYHWLLFCYHGNL